MRKKVLILSNPGFRGAENYCEGVKRDVENYKNFFLSPIGGNWCESEIECLQYATKVEVEKLLESMKGLDFSIIVFVGHGYSQGNKNTYAELRPSRNEQDTTNDLDVEEFREVTQKRIVILDCCRKEWYPILEHNTAIDWAEKSFSMLKNTRDVYEQIVKGMPVMNLFLYSCDFGETSGDDSRSGGFYSSALLDVCYQQARENRNLAMLLLVCG